jgi:predicted RNase H-like nuclease (RuvC/YqgF family)
MPVNVPEGYAYVGPCRCGFGPDAFYRDKNGRIVHAAQVNRRGISVTPATEDYETEMEHLKTENRELEKRISELEKRLETKEREP